MGHHYLDMLKRYTTRLVVAGFCLTASATPCPGADSGTLMELSVEQAVLLALERNQDLKVRRFEPDITATFTEIERSRFDPEFFAEAEYFEEESSETLKSYYPTKFH